MILDGRIKLKCGVGIKSFTKTGLRFDDDSVVDADVVVLATGCVRLHIGPMALQLNSFGFILSDRFGDLREPVKRVIGEELGKKLTRIWNLNEEGELNSIGREIGIPGLWYFSGTLFVRH